MLSQLHCHALNVSMKMLLNSRVDVFSFPYPGSILSHGSQHQAFSYIHAMMNEDLYTEPDREEVAREVLDNFQVNVSMMFATVFCVCVVSS